MYFDGFGEDKYANFDPPENPKCAPQSHAKGASSYVTIKQAIIFKMVYVEHATMYDFLRWSE